MEVPTGAFKVVICPSPKSIDQLVTDQLSMAMLRKRFRSSVRALLSTADTRLVEPAVATVGDTVT